VTYRNIGIERQGQLAHASSSAPLGSRTPKYALGVVSEPAAEEITLDYKKIARRPAISSSDDR